MSHEYLSTRVTRTQGGWLVCLVDVLSGNRCGDSVLVTSRQEIGIAVKDLLRWHDKLGGRSEMAAASRRRAAQGTK